MRTWGVRAVTTGLAAAALLTLTACTARTDVDLTVRSAQSADVTISATFTDEAAEVLAADDSAMDELLATFEARTGRPPQVERTKEKVSVSAEVDYDHLRESGAVTGVSAVRLAPKGEDVQASVELRDTPDLLAALTSATATQPDAAAVASTMARSTHLVVSVTFPGGVHGDPAVVGVSSDAVSVDGGTVTVVRTADAATAGAVVVTGNPRTPTNWAWVAIGGAVVAVAAAAAVAARRDQADRRRT